MTNFRPFCCNSKRMEVFLFLLSKKEKKKVRNLQNKKVEQKEGENKMALIE